MKNKKSFFIGFLFVAIIFVIYRSWFFSQALIGGDLGFLYKQQFGSFTFFSTAWESLYNLGNPIHSLLWARVFLDFFINTLGNFLGYKEILLFGFFLPFLVLGSISSYLLIKKIVKNPLFISLGVLVYMTNTYILMVMGGGQILIGLSYAIAPLCFLVFYNLINRSVAGFDRNVFSHSLLAGFVLSIQAYFDPRLLYVTVFGIVLYFTYFTLIVSEYRKGTTRSFIKDCGIRIIHVFLIPFIVFLLLHAVWLLPTVIYRDNPVVQQGKAYSSVDAVKYFSFAKFEKTVSLLHPNWPENIFGKSDFMKPEFLLLPILAFSSLLFVQKRKKTFPLSDQAVIFFAFLGVIGAFLAKGANEPLGEVYLWMFHYIPGFVMFRDPTKWYVLVAMSYSVLIAFSTANIGEWISLRTKKIKYFSVVCFICLTACFLVLINQAVLGQLSGTFKQSVIPNDYLQLKDFFSRDPEFSRILWIPSLQRFGFYSNTHPSISATYLFAANSTDDIIKTLKTKQTEELLREAGVKYIVLPFDSEHELFVAGRKYDQKIVDRASQALKNISWLQYDKNFGANSVYLLKNPKDHFWMLDGDSKIVVHQINPSEYRIAFNKKDTKRTLVFSELYDSRWVALHGDKKIYSKRFHNQFNSFALPHGQNNLTIYFEPQKWVDRGLAISLSSFVILVSFFILSFLNQTEK